MMMIFIREFDSSVGSSFGFGSAPGFGFGFGFGFDLGTSHCHRPYTI